MPPVLVLPLELRDSKSPTPKPAPPSARVMYETLSLLEMSRICISCRS